MQHRRNSVLANHNDQPTPTQVASLKLLSCDDYRTVAHLMLEQEQQQFAGGPLDSIFSELQNSLHHDLEHPFSLVIPDGIIGFFVLRELEALPKWAPADVITLHSFRVSRPYQGKGYGKAACSLVAQWLLTNRPCINHLMLSVNLRNVDAREAYLKWGFRDTGALCSGPIGPQNILEFRVLR